MSFMQKVCLWQIIKKANFACFSKVPQFWLLFALTVFTVIRAMHEWRLEQIELELDVLHCCSNAMSHPLSNLYEWKHTRQPRLMLRTGFACKSLVQKLMKQCLYTPQNNPYLLIKHPFISLLVGSTPPQKIAYATKYYWYCILLRLHVS